MKKRLIIYLVGLCITALGISLIILSQAGAGPMDMVAVGLNQHLGLTIGVWAILSQAVLVLITGAIEWKRLQLESIIAIVVRSWFLDFWIYIALKDIPFTATWGSQWLTFLLGIVAVGLGIGIYLEARLPRTPIDGLMLAIHNRTGWSLSVSRILIEAGAAIAGYLLGGPIGLGTILIVLILGRIIQFTNKKVKQLLRNPSVAVANH
ncbi:YczE/YyaS/YitT family protein [Halalkalibacter akibai]|uniref:Membrane protein n=1 Tax=Halalkalibacter akibai (strain ATCC 43226 / DSM 21942 / CIP 109018 / JCM 9157 / 1139) TaxID=1236973 RepID=W4QU34_HALA3|nr:YitT family protein [Halalkalibacter akibai]GAE34844.1 membrane protein [Halalkalibacter akibai JCM 9157]